MAGGGSSCEAGGGQEEQESWSCGRGAAAPAVHMVAARTTTSAAPGSLDLEPLLPLQLLHGRRGGRWLACQQCSEGLPPVKKQPESFLFDDIGAERKVIKAN